jgi:hypothetical protein
MGTWTKDVELDVIEFDGDKIQVSVTRIRSEDMRAVLSNYDADGTATGDAAQKVVRIAQELTPKYITKISGMKKPDGTEWTLAELIEVAGDYYFAPLIASIYAGLLEHSTVQSVKK